MEKKAVCNRKCLIVREVRKILDCRFLYFISDINIFDAKCNRDSLKDLFESY